MAKYILEEYVLNEFNASSKARKDVSHFVLANGYLSIGKNDKTTIRSSKFAKFCLALRLFCRILKLSKDDVLFVQSSELILRPITWIKSIRGFKLIYLIHDLFCVAYTQPETIARNQTEIRKAIGLLSKCDIIIAHNNVMIQKLMDYGLNKRLLSLDIFDYECTLDLPCRTLGKSKLSIAFAGNLLKSEFLKRIDETQHTYELFIYGGPAATFKNSHYMGCVEPDLLPQQIKGHFGLIWEGDYNLTVDDNYTRFNNPHKLSMYLVAGLPVIVWSHSAAANFVKKYKVGICIENLDELDTVLPMISSCDYDAYVKNCLSIRQQLVSGEHIRNVLNQIKFR